MSQPDIAVVGKFAAGKSTIASALVERGWERISFASRLKDTAAMVFNGGKPIRKEGLYIVTDLDGQERAITGRTVLQELGQSVKSLDRMFWVRWLKHDLDSGYYGPGPYVIDDCRFPYEAEFLRGMGFTVVRVETPTVVRMERYNAIYGRYPTHEELTHPSETEVDLIRPDMTVNGEEDIDRIVNMILRGQVAA